MEEIGNFRKIRESREKVIEWRIRDFFALRQAVDSRYESPRFHFCGIPWNVRLYPNGQTCFGSEGYIGIYLSRLSNGSPITLDYSFGLKSTERYNDHVERFSDTVFTRKCSYGYPQFIRRSELMSGKDDLAFEEDITIICTLRNYTSVVLPVDRFANNKSTQTESHLIANVSMESLSEDFAELLASGSNPDAEIKCGEKSVKAHKMILSVRSEVFKTMLESDMLESQTGIIEIKDIDDCYIQDFVKYLYSGSLPDMNFEKAAYLYEAGDKYAVRSLVLQCSEYLQNNLSPDTVCECLVLADAHMDKELKKAVTTYILDEKIYLQEEIWLPFCENHTKLANEVYMLSHKATR